MMGSFIKIYFYENEINSYAGCIAVVACSLRQQ